MQAGSSKTTNETPCQTNTQAKRHSDNDNNVKSTPFDPSKKMSNGIQNSGKVVPPSTGSSAGDTEGESSESASAGDHIHVAVRVRPLSEAEKSRGDRNLTKITSENSVLIDNNYGLTKPFTFNRVFPEDSDQGKVFNECGIKHLIDMALEGYSCTVLAFGQTGSGKTYTLTGPVNLAGSNWDENAEIMPCAEKSGLMQRSFRYLIEQMRIKKSSFTLKASYVEVYNEKVQDLLELSASRDSLAVRWSADRGFYIEDLFCVKCETEDDVMAVLEEGLRNRQVRAHCINDHSSRSHCLMTLHVDSETCEPECDGDFVVIKYGRLCFVDLAGNERVKETKTSGDVLTESQNINKSLLTLGNCISALSDSKKRNGYIPYRDSKLTKLLAKSLGGDGMTLMIACVSPSSYLVQDTLNTLRYAQRAKKIKNKPVVQMDPKERLILSLKREIKLIRKENDYFKGQLGLPTSTSPRPSTSSASEPWLTDDGGESLVETPATTDDESRTPTPWQSLSASYTTRLPPGLYDMLQEYMVENENLRTENGDLYTSRDTMRRQNMVISRENDKLLKRLEEFESRSSSAVSSMSRIPSGLSRIRSLSHPSTSDSTPTLGDSTPTLGDIMTSSNDDSLRASPAGDTTPTQITTTASSVVSLPPVRKTRSNPTSNEKVPKATDKGSKALRQQQSQQTLLNIKKDVEWLAKHQTIQRTAQYKTTQNNEGDSSKTDGESSGSNPRERVNGLTSTVPKAIKMSKIPQRVKEPSSYARIFAKHKQASQQKRTDETRSDTHGLEGTRGGDTSSVTSSGSGSSVDLTPGVPVAAAQPTVYAGTVFQDHSSLPNDRLREDINLLTNQIEYYRTSLSDNT